MRRREFIALAGSAAISWPFSTSAQSKMWRVAMLVASSGSPALEAFRQQLHALGYVEGSNIIIETRNANGDYQRLPSLAQELLAFQPNVIVANATPAIAAAQRATSTIPIVMAPATDPIGSGFVKTFARPGGNITGWQTCMAT
jgi:putative tryptophan/tyrosine transport system substrate-binding protein